MYSIRTSLYLAFGPAEGSHLLYSNLFSMHQGLHCIWHLLAFRHKTPQPSFHQWGVSNVRCTSICVISILFLGNMCKVTKYGSNLSTSHLHRSPGNSLTCKWRNPPNPISRVACLCALLQLSIMATNPDVDILV